MNENPDIWTDELKKDIYDAARLTVKLEDDFIDKVFENGEIEGLTPQDIKNYIRFRANTKLNDLGLKQNWKNIDKVSLDRMEWFSIIAGGVEAQDFFAQRPSNYSKSTIDWDKIWE
jgi:ribonucleoside-diphosphate reductase beta chain